MIKINLAARKQAVSARLDDEGKDATGINLRSIMGGFKLDNRLDDLKELPIRKIAVSALACFAVNYYLDSCKEDEIAKVGAALTKVQAEQSKLKIELAKTKGYEEVKKSLESDEQTLRNKVDTIQKLLAARQDPPKLLMALSTAIPQNVWLNSIKITGKDAVFKGESVGFNLISDFMKSLNESAYFTDVRLEGTQREKDGPDLATFELGAKKR